MIEEKALAALGLVRQAFLEDLFILRRERGFLPAPPRLALVERWLAAGRVATVAAVDHGVWRNPALPGAPPVGIFRIGRLGGARGHHKSAGRCDGRDRISVKHGVSPPIILSATRCGWPVRSPASRPLERPTPCCCSTPSDFRRRRLPRCCPPARRSGSRSRAS